MWAWLGLFLQAVLAPEAESESVRDARLATFATIGIAGAIGCIAGGHVADRIGRTTLTMLAMAVSGTCALVIGLSAGGPLWLFLLVCFVWGVAVVADSAQFSASTIELSEPQIVGTMLTVQTCLGFLLTLATIHLMPSLIEALGWRWAFAPLAIGPFLGIWAMLRLRQAPEASKLAFGRR
jgi:MFS family permease